ncbi:MAG: N-6 DNA methylase, partial [Chloroflexales bacterium]
DRVLEESQRHAARIADDLRENIVLAVEALIQGVLDEPANKGLFDHTSPQALQQIFEETLYFLYRLLFLLYAESRDLLPLGASPVYRDTYSLEHLRAMAEQPLHPDDHAKTYYIESLRTLFALLRTGFPAPGRPFAASPFRIPSFNGQLFDLARTALLDRCRIGDQAMREVIRELSLSRPRRRNDRRERYSYADLGVDQLGSIYEGLLVFEPMITGEELVVAKVKGEERLLTRAQAEDQGLAIIEGSVRTPGSFVLRVWGGRRKGSGSYYTPQEITAFLVKEALEPLVEPIVQGCAERDVHGQPRRSPDEILDLKVCDPAMGSAAFLVQACRYLAEAYGRARIAAGLDDDGRISQEELASYKRRVAERCLYGVDLNPMAVELAKVSLWLETLSGDRPLTFLDAHLRCGNALIGAPLRDAAGALSIEGILSIPDAALEEVSKEATKAQKAAARERIKRNREQIKNLQRQRGGQMNLPGADTFDLHAFERTLADTLERRRELEISDEGKSA